MRQGERHYFGRERGIGRRFRIAWNRQHLYLVVSTSAFNDIPGNPVVWGVPYTDDGYDPTNLHYIDRTTATAPADTPADPSAVARVLRFLHWGFVGDGPFWDSTDEQRHAHQQAIDATVDGVSQGDVVVDGEGQTLIVVSGSGFNTTPGSDLLWAVPVEDQKVVHPHLIVTVSRQQVTGTPIEITSEGLSHQLDTIVQRILGLPAATI